MRFELSAEPPGDESLLYFLKNGQEFVRASFVAAGFTTVELLCVGAAGGYSRRWNAKVYDFGGKKTTFVGCGAGGGGGGLYYYKGPIINLPATLVATIGAPGADKGTSADGTAGDGGTSGFKSGVAWWISASGGKGGSMMDLGAGGGWIQSGTGGQGGIGRSGNSGIVAGGGGSGGFVTMIGLAPNFDVWGGGAAGSQATITNVSGELHIAGRGGGGGAGSISPAPTYTPAGTGENGGLGNSLSLSAYAGFAHPGGAKVRQNQNPGHPYDKFWYGGPGGGASLLPLGLSQIYGSKAAGADPNGCAVVRVS